MSDDPDSFLECLAKLLPPAESCGVNRYDSIRQSIESLHSSGLRLIVLLDDFHFPSSSSPSYAQWRTTTTSLLELLNLCVAKEVQESSFFNIFTNMHIGMLARADAVSLFMRVTGAGEEFAKRVAGWCGGSPYILKKAGAMFASGRFEDSVSDRDIESMLFYEIVPYFGQVVSFLAPEAFKSLLAVIRGKAPAQAEKHHLSSLVKQGFLIEGRKISRGASRTEIPHWLRESGGAQGGGAK
jgi:hypothetical protein